MTCNRCLMLDGDIERERALRQCQSDEISGLRQLMVLREPEIRSLKMEIERLSQRQNEATEPRVLPL